MFNCTSSGDIKADLDLLLGSDKVAQKRSAGLFLLKLKECRRLYHVAIDDIVQEWNGLFLHTVQQLNARVCERLASSGVDADSVEGLQDLFQDLPSPFEGLETRHLQEKYFRESLGLVVRLTQKIALYWGGVHTVKCKFMCTHYNKSLTCISLRVN